MWFVSGAFIRVLPGRRVQMDSVPGKPGALRGRRGDPCHPDREERRVLIDVINIQYNLGKLPMTSTG